MRINGMENTSIVLSKCALQTTQADTDAASKTFVHVAVQAYVSHSTSCLQLLGIPSDNYPAEYPLGRA